MHQTSALTTRNLKIAFWLNSAFVIIELFGGLFTNSLAILSDAFHDFGDSISLGLAWYFQHLALRGRDESFTYGYRRFSLLGALVNALILIVGSVLITYFAWNRFNTPQETMSEGMAVLAVIGIVVNYIALKQLNKGHSLNERTIGLHLLADVLGWVGVLIGAIVIYFTNWFVIDAILSLLIAVYICYGAVKNMIESVNIILQRVPKDIDTDQIARELRHIEGVSDLFDLHVWTLDGERTILSVHLVVNESISREQITKIRLQAREMLAPHGIRHSTFEINLPGEVYIDEPDR
jgi:cobalt-zinc-cadmium efflux system protein